MEDPFFVPEKLLICDIIGLLNEWRSSLARKNYQSTGRFLLCKSMMVLYTRRVHEEILEKKDKHLMLEILLNFQQRKIQKVISLKLVNESIV